MIDGFDPTYYSHAYLGMAALVKATDSSSCTYADVFASLGRHVVANPPPEEQRLPLLNDIWKTVAKSDDLLTYVKCSLAWIEAVQKHYSERETLILLADLSDKLSQHNGDVSDAILNQLDSIVTCLVSGSAQGIGSAVLTSEHLLKILDVCKGPKKVHICKVRSRHTCMQAYIISNFYNPTLHVYTCHRTSSKHSNLTNPRTT